MGMVIQHRLKQGGRGWSQQPFGAFLLPREVLLESYRLLSSGQSRGERPVGFLGVRLEDLTELEKDRMSIDSGVLVAYAERRFPAWRAGIRARDIVVAIDEQTVSSRGEAIAIIAGCQRGERVPIRVRRNGRFLDLHVEMADRSDF